MKKAVRQDNAYAFTVVAKPFTTYFLVITDNDKIVGMHRAFCGVDSVTSSALQAHGHQQALHTPCVVRHGQTFKIVYQYNIVANMGSVLLQKNVIDSNVSQGQFVHTYNYYLLQR